MSMETHVFFRGTLPGKTALSRAMRELEFPFSITPATGSLEAQRGFMPMKLRGEETGVEFSVYGDHAAVEEFADAGVDPTFERRASLRWGGDFQEAAAGMCVAATLAKLLNGVVFDEAEDRLLSVDDAIAVARQNLRTLLKPEEEDKKRRGTRPADLKHYLKPLLKQRSDLVLIGRLLIVRPVRHLLRGVFFDRTSDKYKFQVSREVRPLFSIGADVSLGYPMDIHPVRWKVWEPHFKALLFDALAEEIFDVVGKITTFANFRDNLGDYGKSLQFVTLVLAGQRERAAELIDRQPDRDHPRYWPFDIDEQRALLDRDVESLCAEFRAKESHAAKALKFGDAWEPAPFPAEVPAAERARQCDEPVFLTEPWVPRPPRLVEEPPRQVGEIRFARDVLWRKGSVVLFVPLTREEAQEKHETRLDYALVTRLPDENLLVLYHHSSWNPHDPEASEKPRYLPKRDFSLEIHGNRGRLLRAQFDEDFDRRGVLRFWSVSFFAAVSQGVSWSAHNDIRNQTIMVWDHRNDPRGYVKRPMADSDVALCVFPEPRFGDSNDLWQRVETYLHNEGFGTLPDNSKP